MYVNIGCGSLTAVIGTAAICIDDDGKGVYLENLYSCDSCYGRDDGSSVVLQGLSEATDLELISNPRVVRFLFPFLFFLSLSSQQCPLL